MFEVRIVVALAFVCLQVWCAGANAVDNYVNLFECIIKNEGPFEHFIPFRIGNFPFSYSKFSGHYENVNVGNIEYNDLRVAQTSNFTNGTVVIKFRHIFFQAILQGYLIKSNDRRNFDNEVNGYIENLTLEGEVSYGNQKVTKLNMIVTFVTISLEGQNVLLPFTNGETERYYRNYLANNKEAIENGTIALINEKIDTPAKFASIKAGCGLV